MPDASKIRILICDDHPIVRAGFRGMISGQSDLEVVGEAGDGREAVERVASLRPAVVLMDLRMPEMDGVAAITRIRRTSPRPTFSCSRPTTRTRTSSGP